MKLCNRCHKHRRQNYPSQPSHLCRHCHAKRAAKYRNSHRLEVRRRGWNSKHKAMYGITLDEKEAIFHKQGDKCAICGSTESGMKGRGWYSDHSHKTGAFRGVLCGPCNLLLGCAKDSSNILHAAFSYLVAHENDPSRLKFNKIPCAFCGRIFKKHIHQKYCSNRCNRRAYKARQRAK